ncbi:MAG: hypothetical protein ABH829_00355 [archaeon]
MKGHVLVLLVLLAAGAFAESDVYTLEVGKTGLLLEGLRITPYEMTYKSQFVPDTVYMNVYGRGVYANRAFAANDSLEVGSIVITAMNVTSDQNRDNETIVFKARSLRCVNCGEYFDSYGICGDRLCSLYENPRICKADCNATISTRSDLVGIGESISFNGGRIRHIQILGDLLQVNITRRNGDMSTDLLRSGQTLELDMGRMTLNSVSNDGKVSIKLEPLVDYCGNIVCEIGEDFDTCPQDCDYIERVMRANNTLEFSRYIVKFLNATQDGAVIEVEEGTLSIKKLTLKGGDEQLLKGAALRMSELNTSAGNQSALLVIGETPGATDSPSAPSPSGKKDFTVTVFANYIDWDLGNALRGGLDDKNIGYNRVIPDDVSGKKEEKYIVVLGGPDAPDKIGTLVREILNYEEEEQCKAGVYIHYKRDMWIAPQKVVVLCGPDRYGTMKAARDYIGGLVQYLKDG